MFNQLKTSVMSINSNNRSELESLFNSKLTENGDLTHLSTGNKMLDILFMTEYYSKHLDETPLIGHDKIDKLFAMFIRDPRAGLGRRDLGRRLLKDTLCSSGQILQCGRADDLWHVYRGTKEWHHILDCIKMAIEDGREVAYLLKKWLPRYSSKDLMVAREIASYWKMNKQQYGHFIKCDTVEQQMSRNHWNEIEFDHVPSLAAIKYVQAFKRHEPERYEQYIQDVKDGKKKLNVSTTNVYDIYKHCESIDADLFFSKLEKISGSWIPIVDTSGSMWDSNDSIGKALSIGYTLSRTSTYAPNEFLTFSVRPQLVRVSGKFSQDMHDMDRADWENNTDLSKVMSLLKELKDNYPDWLVILSDMQFDQGSCQSVRELMNHFRTIGAPTKILWWNFRCSTVPEKDSDGNVYLSGYNPRLLQYLQAGFDGKRFLNTLLQAYQMRFHAWEDLRTRVE